MNGWLKVRLAFKLSRWLQQNHVALRDLNETRVAAFLNARWKRLKRHVGDQTTMALLLRHLRQINIVPASVAVADNDIDRTALDYESFLVGERSVQPSSVEVYLDIARRFSSTLECHAHSSNLGVVTTSQATTDSSMASSGRIAPQPAFVTTHWSVVQMAGRENTTRAVAALEKLCHTYWYPLYAYVRRRGYSPEDAKDLTQGFFLRLLEQRSLTNANPDLGRFRSFLLGALNHFLISEWKKSQSKRRGGGRQMFSLDWAAAEQRFDLEPAGHATPDKAFDKQWATALLDEVLQQLENEYRRERKSELFQALKQTLAGARESQPYATLADQLGMNEGALRVAVHRLRKRYRALLQAEIANTVTAPEEVKEEMAYLFRAMAGN